MKKFAFIGAGSFGFTRNLVRDILSFPAFADCTIALMDLDEERLGFIKQAVDKIVAAGNYPATVIATTNRAEALQGADGVVCTILANSVDVWRSDIEIPKKYGVDINVGDTRGPAGVFRALRTIPVMLDICRDIEKICPDAVFLNYTNPMTMLCNAMQNYTKVNVIGLCHSVQGTAEMLAGWIGAEAKDISYLCGGINHQAWFLEYKWNGKDAIPLIREAITSRPDIYNAELVRNEMFLHLDYYVTESSGHNSEYNAWFRKRPDLIEKYCTHGTNWNPGLHAYILNEYKKRQTTWKDEIVKWLNEAPIELNRGHEYASEIFNAIFGDGTMFKFYGNINNKGYITNLPQDVCVEVPVLASKYGFEPIHVGALPGQLAALNTVNAINEQLAVEGSITGDPRKVFHAIVNDPLTSAVLSLNEIEQMVDEMFAANRDYLPQFKHVN
ncbi:alpha-galactosidase [Paenibacillus contaminans]|uniref:Alpha-glucosidase/alpha-galactosidase n=1 Tax=Paenibacillus contaminans TaxID=450362 RepID=A0A329MUB0_9BACL|nr:alpha-galactosidase [Paenibacillus contaminans]RAV23262.1 alpha-glucosidase/alpha-galactosidase [Paenibacillus contaminans]